MDKCAGEYLETEKVGTSHMVPDRYYGGMAMAGNVGMDLPWLRTVSCSLVGHLGVQMLQKHPAEPWIVFGPLDSSRGKPGHEQAGQPTMGDVMNREGNVLDFAVGLVCAHAGRY